MNRFEKLSLIIGAIANLGVIASFLFTIWLHREQQETKLIVSCRPALGEPCEIDKSMDSGYVINYNLLCSAANNSSYPVSVRSVYVMSEGALGNWPHGSWGSTGGDTLKEIAEHINIYDSSAKSSKVILPKNIPSGDTLSFIVKGEIAIGNDLISAIDSKCKQSMKHNIVPRVFFEDCLHRSIFFNPMKDTKQYESITTSIEVVTTAGLRIKESNMLSISSKTDK